VPIGVLEVDAAPAVVVVDLPLTGEAGFGPVGLAGRRQASEDLVDSCSDTKKA
jgi:hypothetical protein